MAVWMDSAKVVPASVHDQVNLITAELEEDLTSVDSGRAGCSEIAASTCQLSRVLN